MKLIVADLQAFKFTIHEHEIYRIKVVFNYHDLKLCLATITDHFI